MSEIAGEVFAPPIAKVNVSVVVKPPASVTETVMIAVPVWPAPGVTVMLRLVSLPPRTMFPLGTTN